MDQHLKSKTNEKIIANWGGRSLGRSLVQNWIKPPMHRGLLTKTKTAHSFPVSPLTCYPRRRRMTLFLLEKWAWFGAGSSNCSLVECGKILVAIEMIEFWLGVHNTASCCFLNVTDWVNYLLIIIISFHLCQYGLHQNKSFPFHLCVPSDFWFQVWRL